MNDNHDDDDEEHVNDNHDDDDEEYVNDNHDDDDEEHVNDNHVNLIGPTTCVELSARNGLKSIELATVAHDRLIFLSSLSSLSSSSSLSSLSSPS